MAGKSIEALVCEKEAMTDLLEDLLTKIQEIREEFTSELDELEDMIAER